MVATKPFDFRNSSEGLAPLLREKMGADPFARTLDVFRARRADRVKLICWDGTGACLFVKGLEDGTFRWPNMEGGVISLSAAQLSALIEGIDWRRLYDRHETPVPVVSG